MKKLITIIALFSTLISYGSNKEPEIFEREQKAVPNTNVIFTFKEDSTIDGYKWVYSIEEISKKYKVIKASEGRQQHIEDKFEFIFSDCGVYRIQFSYVSIRDPNTNPKYIIKQKITVKEDVELDWVKNFETAKLLAKQQNKYVLLVFTGSDWCSPCKSLENYILETKKFKEFADKHFILIKADFPKHTTLDQPTRTQNNQLKNQYKISSYPTVFILDYKGNECGKMLGYRKDWFDKLETKMKEIK